MAEPILPGSSEPVSDLLLERYALGELPLDLKRRVEARLDVDPALSARLDSLRASDETLLKQYPPEVVVPSLRNLLRRERVEMNNRNAHTGRSSAYFLAKPVFAAALVLAAVSIPLWQFGRSVLPPLVDEGLVAVISVPEPSVIAPEPTKEGTRIKGLDPAIALFRRTDQGAEALKPGATVRPGDVLRVGYRSGGFPFGAIFSVDGNGSVTRHWPLAGDGGGRLEAGEQLLPGAFMLDAAPDYERFFLLVSEEPFNLNPELEALLAGNPPRTRGLQTIRFELLKDNGI